MQLGLSRNVLYMLVGALVVVVAVLGYQLYQDRKEPKGMQINVGPSGITIEKNKRRITAACECTLSR